MMPIQVTSKMKVAKISGCKKFQEIRKAYFTLATLSKGVKAHDRHCRLLLRYVSGMGMRISACKHCRTGETVGVSASWDVDLLGLHGCHRRRGDEAYPSGHLS